MLMAERAKDLSCLKFNNKLSNNVSGKKIFGLIFNPASSPAARAGQFLFPLGANIGAEL